MISLPLPFPFILPQKKTVPPVTTPKARFCYGFFGKFSEADHLISAYMKYQ